MSSLKSKFASLWSDEQGAEVIEYALIIGLIVVACIVIISRVGTKALARWVRVNSSI